MTEQYADCQDLAIELAYCSYCEQKPGQPCVSRGGAITSVHMTRVNPLMAAWYQGYKEGRVEGYEDGKNDGFVAGRNFRQRGMVVRG
jgi:hypothetical protein